MSKIKKSIYIFRYHGRSGKILSELINNIIKNYNGEFISIEDQNEISFLLPIFNFISWKTPKKFIVMSLTKNPTLYCKNCNLPIILENTYLQKTNLELLTCKSCNLPLIIKDSRGKIDNRRLYGESKEIEKFIKGGWLQIRRRT